MNIEKDFPLRFLINLGRREDRRITAAEEIRKAGFTFERFSGIDARNIRREATECFRKEDSGLPVRHDHYKGYESLSRYALALTKRLAIRRAKSRRAPSVLLLEDDVVFHPNFKQLIELVDIPEDWGILYLGCSHAQPPLWHSPRLVRVNYAVDNHAVAINAKYFDRVSDVINRHNKDGTGVPGASDQFIATLHRDIPTYACYPNLAWQATSHSDLVNEAYSNYSKDGSQLQWRENVRSLIPCVTSGYVGPNTSIQENIQKSKMKLGLLFLTRSEVNLPSIWKQFVEECPDRVRIFSHPKTLPSWPDAFISKNNVISKIHDTSWGHFSLVEATRELLLYALNHEDLTHFALLSESCVPIKPLSEILRELTIDPRSRFNYEKLNGSSQPKIRARVLPATKVNPECWHFQSQWWVMNRDAAVFSTAESFVDIFKDVFCVDEAYFATVLALQGFPMVAEVNKKISTWTHWEEGSGSPTRWKDVPEDKIIQMSQSGAFFARKFSIDSDIASYRLHLNNFGHIKNDPVVVRRGT